MSILSGLRERFSGTHKKPRTNNIANKLLLYDDYTVLYTPTSYREIETVAGYINILRTTADINAIVSMAKADKEIPVALPIRTVNTDIHIWLSDESDFINLDIAIPAYVESLQILDDIVSIGSTSSMRHNYLVTQRVLDIQLVIVSTLLDLLGALDEY